MLVAIMVLWVVIAPLVAVIFGRLVARRRAEAEFLRRAWLDGQLALLVRRTQHSVTQHDTQTS